MRIKKYIAKSMREALMQIKEELGEDAIILKTRKLPKKVFTLGAQDEVEVTAAIDDENSRAPEFEPIKMKDTGVYGRPRSTSIISPPERLTSDIKPWVPPSQNSNSRSVINRFTSASREDYVKEKPHYVEIKENIKELRELLQNVIESGGTVPNGALTGGWALLYKRMVDSEVRPDIAEKVVRSIGGGEFASDIAMEKKLLSLLEQHFPVAGPLKLKKDGPSVVVFVGPTGSGKTTTLAKLAAHCCLNKHKSVSIITADTYRIAAIEQIRMFADIVKVGLQVVFSPDEVISALQSCAHDDVVFVDTAGRSQRDTEHMNDLKELVESLKPDETHLVLSATTKDSDLLDNIQRYRPVNINRLLFTKLDETVRLGNVFNTVNQSGVPVSYFTFGQSVPDDIELARPGRFVQRLWEGTLR